MENIAHSHGIPGTEGQSATVIDAPHTILIFATFTDTLQP